MRINQHRNVEGSAWADGNSVQLRFGPFGFTATEVEAVDLARQIVAAVDVLKAGGMAAANGVAHPTRRGVPR
jgi:hypothetical protein